VNGRGMARADRGDEYAGSRITRRTKPGRRLGAERGQAGGGGQIRLPGCAA